MLVRFERYLSGTTYNFKPRPTRVGGWGCPIRVRSATGGDERSDRDQDSKSNDIIPIRALGKGRGDYRLSIGVRSGTREERREEKRGGDEDEA